jgi:hypothetical protein
VGPRAGVDTEARGKILSPMPGIEPRSPGRPARSQTLYRLIYPAHSPFKIHFNVIFPSAHGCLQVVAFFFFAAKSIFRSLGRSKKSLPCVTC